MNARMHRPRNEMKVRTFNQQWNTIFCLDQVSNLEYKSTSMSSSKSSLCLPYKLETKVLNKGHKLYAQNGK